MGTKVTYAYEEPIKQQAARRANAFKVGLVAADCVLLGLQPVLVHLSKNDKGKFSFNPVAVNLLTELAKTAFALATLVMLGTGRPGRPMYASLRAFLRDAHHNRLLAVPAAFYAINNYLKFTMQLYFRPTTTKMLGNLKIFSIAILMRTVMGRTFTVIQYEALFLLVAGITVNQLQGCTNSAEALPAASILPAMLCVLGSVTVPSAASVYNEFALKRHMDTSVHLQNFFLYFYGALFNLAGAAAVCVIKGQGLGELFAHQSRVTAWLIVTNAAQGILSSFFYKYADTILKKYSSTLATILTALASWAMFAHPLTANFLLGVSIVFVSMHQFFTFGEGKKGAPAAAAAAPSPPPGAPANGVAIEADGRRGSRMLHSPSFDHIRVTASPSPPGSSAALAALASGAESGGAGAGGGAASRAPLLPR